MKSEGTLMIDPQDSNVLMMMMMKPVCDDDFETAELDEFSGSCQCDTDNCNDMGVPPRK